jgi:hypothetical protein
LPSLVTVHLEQARLVADAIARRDALTRELSLMVGTLAAGQVPAGAQLVDVNVDTGVLTFEVPHAG